jgi:hypothetical protein
MPDANCALGLRLFHFSVRGTVMEGKIRRELELVVPRHFVE